MHKPNYLTIGLIVAFVALGAGLGWNYWQTQQHTQQAAQQREFVPNFSAEAVTDIAISTAGTTTTLQKQSDQWIITSDNNAVADTAAITNLLSTLADSTIQATIATNIDQADNYNLSPDQQTRITVKADSTTVLDVLVGKAGKPTATWYGARADAATIYLLSGTRDNLVKDSWNKVDTTS